MTTLHLFLVGSIAVVLLVKFLISEVTDRHEEEQYRREVLERLKNVQDGQREMIELITV